MHALFSALRQQWQSSVRFRIAVILGAVYLIARVILALLWNMGVLVIEDFPPINDLQVYLEAGRHFLERRDLYFAPRPDFTVYVYSPVFAMLFAPLARLPYTPVLLASALLHIAAYGLLYMRWFSLFQSYHLDAAKRRLVALLPLWLVFTAFYYDVQFLNVYVFMALLATLLLEAVLAEKLGKAILWLALLLLVKPHWAFALGVPLLTGRWRFFARLVIGGLLAYLAAAGMTLLIGGAYVWAQYQGYIRLLTTVSALFPWNTLAEQGRIGYNHSIAQMVIFFLGATPRAFGIATVIKGILTLPMIALAVASLRRASGDRSTPQPSRSIAIALALYLCAFIWMDVLTELNLSILIFTYLQSTLRRRERALAWLFFGPYALSDAWVLFSGAAALFINIPAQLTTPDRFIPLVLIALLACYLLLIRSLLGRKATD
jgi:hypothetical protein